MPKPSRPHGGMSTSVDCDPPSGLLALEPRLLLSATGVDNSTPAHDPTHAHSTCCACAACCAIESEFDAAWALDEASSELDPVEAASAEEIAELFVTQTTSTSDTFKLHSNPGATKVIYLDFNGHTTRDTLWNYSYGSTITTPAYDFDGNTSSFSSAELTRIQRIWQRVAEDFIPFNVDVTTQDPGVDNLSNDGDGRYGIRVVIGGSSTDWYTGGGGVAYNGTFDATTDTPTFVFENNLGNGSETYVAQAITHEVGHTLGLSHDGTSGSSYYAGHGSGTTGWAPLMGTAYTRNVTQWSRGEYSGANNKQDDLAIITSGNGFGYRSDDHGGSTGSASNLAVNGSDVADSGIIERNTDFDVFSFNTDGGTVSFDIDVLSYGANLDVQAELLNSSGSVIATSNPADALGATITKSVASGKYYLRITGVGKGSPTTGYSDYGSLGQYAITGTTGDTAPAIVPEISINNVAVNEDNGTARFTLTLSRATTEDVLVRATTENGSANAGSDFDARSQWFTFNPGQTSKTFTVNITDDSNDESNETFIVNLSSPSGLTIKDGRGVATIVDNDDPPVPDAVIPAVSINNVAVNEHDGVARFRVTLSESPTESVSVRAATDANSASTSDFTARTQTLTFRPGQTSTTFDVQIKDDTADEANESLLVRLSSPKGLTIADGVGVGTIVDDDLPLPAAPLISIADQQVKERDSNKRGIAKKSKVKFIVRLSQRPTGPVTVNWSTADSSAKAGEDYIAQTGTIEFKGRKLKRKFTVFALGDRLAEGDEKFRIRLWGAQGAAIGDASADVLIIDNDVPAATPHSIPLPRALFGLDDLYNYGSLDHSDHHHDHSDSPAAQAIRDVLTGDADEVIHAL